MADGAATRGPSPMMSEHGREQLCQPQCAPRLSRPSSPPSSTPDFSLHCSTVRVGCPVHQRPYRTAAAWVAARPCDISIGKAMTPRCDGSMAQTRVMQNPHILNMQARIVSCRACIDRRAGASSVDRTMLRAAPGPILAGHVLLRHRAASWSHARTDRVNPLCSAECRAQRA